MLPGKLSGDETGTIGLPIRIVVLSIVGLAGFYAIISAISSMPSPPEPMYARTNASTFSFPPASDGYFDANLTLLVTVLDRDNRRIGEANVIAWSPDRKKAVFGVTDTEGNVLIRLANPELPQGKAEGYVAIKVMRTGYRDFENDYFVKVTRS
ncbi:hypothetical protein FTO70_06880 [Methanosarcina sp. KYL-1]|uniref:hypothetical protein n=1 Tax=Methanosarcina sp. KYL-1 TaxID=2602068 RepID=UPI002101D0E5|nr:hypothetical protein [Methanosarcina sp. KYL-1]MCQ1535415.1 hypothetical protein [Methanosarcina sp. KYL-1]